MINYASDFARVLNEKMGKVEMIDHTLYDTLAYPGDLDLAQSLKFFTMPFDGKKTAEYTNMVLPSQLPASQAFLVESVCVMVKGDPSRLPWRVMFGGVYELLIGSKIYFSGSPLASIYSLDGSGRELSVHLALTQQCNFCFTLRWPILIQIPGPIKFQARLRGKLYCPVA